MSLHATADTSRDAFAIHRPYHAYTRSELAQETGIKLSAVWRSRE